MGWVYFQLLNIDNKLVGVISYKESSQYALVLIENLYKQGYKLSPVSKEEFEKCGANYRTHIESEELIYKD